MKKFLFFVGILMLTACSGTIDKKVNLETVKDDLKEIREKYKDDYTDEDFDALSNELVGSVFGAALTKGDIKDVKFDKTYKQYLDEAKEKRLEKEKIAKELTEAVNVKVVKFSRERGEGFAADYEVNMPISVNIKNNSSKDIEGVTGGIEITDMFGKNVENLKFEITEPIKAKSEIAQDYIYDIGIGNLKDIDETGFNKLKFKWVPEKIVFSDGTFLPKETKK